MKNNDFNFDSELPLSVVFELISLISVFVGEDYTSLTERSICWSLDDNNDSPLDYQVILDCRKKELLVDIDAGIDKKTMHALMSLTGYGIEFEEIFGLKK